MPAQVHTIHIAGVCAYLIETQSGLVLVDAGWPRTERPILRRMRALGRSELRLIFITHAHLDHYGSAAALRRLTGAPIAIHRADAAFMARGETPVHSARSWGRLGRWFLRVGHGRAWVEPASADVLLDDGDDLRAWGLDARVVHTPGHTPGSACLWVEQRLLFMGDLLSSNGQPHMQRLYACDWSQMPSSLARAQALRPAWVYPGHALRPVSGGAFQAVKAGYG